MRVSSKIAIWLTVLLAAILRLPGFFWGFDPSTPFIPIHHDETRLAIFVANYLEGEPAARFYFYGFTTQLLPFLVPLKLLSGSPGPLDILTAGRLLNLISAAAMVWLVFRLTLLTGASRRAAHLAALFVAVCPMHVIESQYAAPSVNGTLWLYASFFFALRYAGDRRREAWLAACFCAGAAIAVKFGFVTLIPLIYLAVSRRVRGSRLAAGILLLTGAFFVFNGCHWIGPQIEKILFATAPDNFASRDIPRWLNPVTYLLLLVPGLTAPMLLLAATGLFRMKKEGYFRRQPRFWCLEAPLLAQTAVLFAMTATYSRHLIPLAVYAAIVSGRASDSLWADGRKSFVIAALLYASAASAWAGGGLLRDNVFAARSWFLANVPAPVKLCVPVPDAFTGLLSPDRFTRVPGQSSYVLLSESHTLPFRRSELTPYSSAPRPSQRQYAVDDKKQEFIEKVYLEKRYRRIRLFSRPEIFPEFILYKSFFGSYFWRQGDCMVYRRID